MAPYFSPSNLHVYVRNIVSLHQSSIIDNPFSTIVPEAPLASSPDAN